MRWVMTYKSENLLFTYYNLVIFGIYIYIIYTPYIIFDVSRYIIYKSGCWLMYLDIYTYDIHLVGG